MARSHHEPGPSWAEARSIAHETALEARTLRGERPSPADRAAKTALGTETVSLHDALGRFAAHDVHTGLPLPHYASSAMDGWAVAGLIDPTGDSTSGNTSPGRWQVVSDTIPPSVAALRPGEAARVVTGGLIPEGTDVVIALEDVTAPENLDAAVSLRPGAPAKALTPGRHIRTPGTEAAQGALLVPFGERLTPPDLALIAASGADELEVLPLIDVALVRSGNEVVNSGIPAPGRVRDSFSLLLPPALATWGARMISQELIPDERAATEAALGKDVPLIVSTGGTGPSAVDHFYPSMTKLGGQVRIPSVAMRPGHPAMLALMPGGRIAAALPGNPLAALSAAVTIVEPVLAGLRGAPLTQPTQVCAGADIPALPGRTRVLPGVIDEAGVRESGWTGSGMLRGLARAQVLMIIPPGGVKVGEPLSVLPVPWQTAPSYARAHQSSPYHMSTKHLSTNHR